MKRKIQNPIILPGPTGRTAGKLNPKLLVQFILDSQIVIADFFQLSF